MPTTIYEIVLALHGNVESPPHTRVFFDMQPPPADGFTNAPLGAGGLIIMTFMVDPFTDPTEQGGIPVPVFRTSRVIVPPNKRQRELMDKEDLVQRTATQCQGAIQDAYNEYLRTHCLYGKDIP